MATKLFLRSTQTNAIGATYFDMVTAAGSGAATAVVNSAASGTEIQWTQAAGGSVIQFVSGRAPSGGFTLTSTDISIWAHESNGQANCGGRFRVFKRAANGAETELGGGPFNDGVEFGTSAAEMLWVGNVTDTAFAEDDRILLKIYITNVGTMGAGRTCTLTYNAANAATGDSFFNIAETVSFKSESTTHATTSVLTGQIGAVAGSAAHVAKHAASGTLSGQIGSVAGSASSKTVRPSSGALAGQGSTVVGSASSKTVRASSGALAGPGAALSGSAARAGATVSHATSGALVGQIGSLSGEAARLRAFGAVAALAGPGAVIAGSAARAVAPATHATSGILISQLGQVAGQAEVRTPGKRFARRYRLSSINSYMVRRS